MSRQEIRCMSRASETNKGQPQQLFFRNSLRYKSELELFSNPKVHPSQSRRCVRRKWPLFCVSQSKTLGCVLSVQDLFQVSVKTSHIAAKVTHPVSRPLWKEVHG